MGSVLLSNAVVDQGAVMVEPSHTFVAEGAVLDPVWLLLVAGKAVSFCIVEVLGEGCGASVLDSGRDGLLGAQVPGLRKEVITDLPLTMK